MSFWIKIKLSEHQKIVKGYFSKKFNETHIRIMGSYNFQLIIMNHCILLIKEYKLI